MKFNFYSFLIPVIVVTLVRLLSRISYTLSACSLPVEIYASFSGFLDPSRFMLHHIDPFAVSLLLLFYY